jgi:hypothetical protein
LWERNATDPKGEHAAKARSENANRSKAGS